MTLYVYQCRVCGDITPTVVLVDTPTVPGCMHHRDGKTSSVPMERVTDRAILMAIEPPMAAPAPSGYGLVPLKVSHLKAAGMLIPETQHALDWLWRHRATNGFAEAFKLVGGRRCVDLVAFARIVREKQA